MKFTRSSHLDQRAIGWRSAGLWLLGSLGSNAYAQGAPAVALQLDGAWPAELAIEVRKDVGASLNERGVVVLAEGDPAARATLRISPPSAGVPQVQVQVVNAEHDVASARELSLAQEHPDTWSVAIAATADELLAATWSLPGTSVPANGVPPVVERALLSPPPAFAHESRRGEVGVGVALEQYLPNAQLYGADLFGALTLSPRWQLELGGWFRDVAAQESASGEVYGTVVGGDVVLSANLMRGSWLGLDVLTGAHGGIVWFDGRADAGVASRSVTGALLSARLGGRASVVTTERTRLGLTATAGVPVVTATATDSGKDVIQLRGLELAARFEVGWQF